MKQEVPENMPGVIFQAVARARRQATQVELTAQGLGDLGNPMILFLLNERGEDGRVSAQRELADALRVSPATIAVSLKSLEREGYVEKLSDEKDQRRKGIRLTPKGEGAVRRCLMVFRAVDRHMFEGFSPEEVEQISAFHIRMLQNLRGEHPGERRPCQC